MSDLIRRQDAIDAIRKDVMGGLNYESIISGLPSAQPEYTEQDVRDSFNSGYACGMEAAQPEYNSDEWCDGCKEYDLERHCCPRWNHFIRRTIAEIKAEQKWIPVTERLPEEDVKVLVTDDAGGMTDIDVDSCGRYDDTGERFWYTSQHVIAWMPLPEPYKEGDAE